MLRYKPGTVSIEVTDASGGVRLAAYSNLHQAIPIRFVSRGVVTATAGCGGITASARASS